MNYFDKYNCVRGARGASVENPMLFSALLFILAQQDYPKHGVFLKFLKGEVKNLSRDESLGLLCLGIKKLSWKRIFWMLKDFPSGTILDFSVYLNYRFPKVFWFLLPIIFIMMVWKIPAHVKKTTFPVRWWIQLTQEYQHTVDLPDGGKRHFYTNNKVWSEHPESLEGKILNIVRLKILSSRAISESFAKVFNKFYKGSIQDIMYRYFLKDASHPIVAASRGVCYKNIY